MNIFDIFAHGLWGGIVCGRKNNFLWAVMFGMLPDFLSFGLLAIVSWLQGSPITDAPPVEMVPQWTVIIYKLTHSFIIAGIIVGVIYGISRRIGWAACAWLLHIAMDIPSHTQDYFPTEFLYPLSSFTWSGTDSPLLHIGNWIVLMILYVFYLRSKLIQRRLGNR